MDSSSGSRQIAGLLDSHGAALELYAAQWAPSPADCVQEAFIQLATRIEQLGDLPENPVAWLYRVVRNHALNAARSQRRRVHYEQIAARLTEQKGRARPAATEGLPLLEAVDSLPAVERETVVLRVWSDLTWQEIASITNTSSSSAHRRYIAALEKLKKRLEPSCLQNLT